MPASKANRGKRISEAEFRRLWSDLTITVEAIGIYLGITAPAVSARAKSRGLPRRGYNRTGQYLIGPDREAEFRAMWLGSVMSKDIVAHFRTYDAVISDTAARLGLPPRGKGFGHYGISLAEYRERQIATGLAASAAETRAAMHNAEMVDRPTQMWRAA